MTRTIIAATAALLAAAAFPLSVSAGSTAEEIVLKAFSQAPADWAGRLEQDMTNKVCSETRNSPSVEIGKEIQAVAVASIKYPEDGKLLGDWKNGEKIAQSGYGMRFSDYPAARETGGNCYACHQLTKEEVSYGTVGPSLLGYGKLRDFSEEAIKAAYDKIYNPHAALPCSMMPRFGTNEVLSIAQIKDLVALLMSPESPVNK